MHLHPSKVSFSSYANAVRNFSVVSASTGISGVSRMLNAKSPMIERLVGYDGETVVDEYISLTPEEVAIVWLLETGLPNTRRVFLSQDGTPTQELLSLLNEG